MTLNSSLWNHRAKFFPWIQPIIRETKECGEIMTKFLNMYSHVMKLWLWNQSKLAQNLSHEEVKILVSEKSPFVAGCVQPVQPKLSQLKSNAIKPCRDLHRLGESIDSEFIDVSDIHHALERSHTLLQLSSALQLMPLAAAAQFQDTACHHKAAHWQGRSLRVAH